MDIIYTSLERRPEVGPAPASEVAEAVDALWAHATAHDGLEHASGHAEPDRIDLLLYLLTPQATAPLAPDAAQRAAALIARCHHDSPLLNHRYLPPVPRDELDEISRQRATP